MVRGGLSVASQYLWIVNDSRRFEVKFRPKSNQTAAWPEYSTALRVTLGRPVHDYAIRTMPFRFRKKIPESFALVRSQAQERKRRDFFIRPPRRLLEIVDVHR